MSNIQTFNAHKVAATPSISNVSAGKNLVNINLTNANLHHQEANKGAFDGNVAMVLTEDSVREYTLEELMAFDEEINTSLSESDLKDKSLEEILKEGQETHEEVILARNQAAAQEAIDKINDIGNVNLDSGDEIQKAKEAIANLTDEQLALIPPETLEKIEKAEAELKRQQSEEEARKKAEEEKNKPWYQKFGETAGTFVLSAVEGFLDVGEGVFDSLVYGAGETLQIFGVDDKWAEDIIAYDVSAEFYEKAVEMTGIDKEVAYGKAHGAGKFVGEMLGYYALSSIPFVGTALSIQGGAGKGIEESINTQLAETGEVKDWKVAVAGGLGALEGYGFGKATQGISSGIKAVGKTGVKQTIKSTVGSASKETLKTTAKNSGKIVVTAAGRTFTDVDTYVDVAAVVGDDVIKGIDTGEWDWGTIIKEGSVAIGGNYIGNLGAGVLDSATGKTQTVDLDDGKKTQDVDTTTFRKNAYNEYLNSGKLKGGIDKNGFKIYPPDEDLFIKYYDVYTNPKYCDIETGEIFWPQAEGAKQFLGLTDADLVKLGKEGGVSALTSPPYNATEVDLKDLEGTKKTRYTTKPNDDGGGEYFGNTTDSKESRALNPYSNENAKLVEYEFTGSTGEGKYITVNGQKLRVGTDCKISCVQTNAAEWFGSDGGAQQFVFYITDMDGKILQNNSMQNQLAHATVQDLKDLGIIK